MKHIVLIPSLNPDEKLIELLKTIDKKVDIIVVNDGSSHEYDSIFSEVKKYAHVISYKENKGKGYALKEGFKYIKENYKEYIVVTMDADKQHEYKDALKLLEYASEHLNTLVIGRRHWDNKTPITSRIGNAITRRIYKVTTGIKIYDTQSGLRSFSYKLMDYMLEIDGERYEYEMNVLLNLKESNIDVKEINIKTIYIDNNKGSHYKVLKDSYRILKVINNSNPIYFNRVLALILIFLFSFMVFYVIFYDLGKNQVLNNIVKITKTDKCDYKPKLYYVYNDTKIYLYCLDKVEVKSNRKYIDLKEYLQNNDIDSLINGLKKVDSLFDGGTTIYKDGGTKELRLKGFKIIKCNKLKEDGINKDIYFGPKSMEYKDNFCEDNNITFVRTYRVNKVTDYNEQQYEDGTPVYYGNSRLINITDSYGNTEDVILNNNSFKFKEGKLYEFEFKKLNNDIIDTIESIFKNTSIVEIRKTNKERNEAIN